MNEQPTALRLADALEVDKWHISGVTAQSAADELRRLHEKNAKMLDLLYIVLPFIEDAERDPAYKPGAVAKVTNSICSAIDEMKKQT